VNVLKIIYRTAKSTGNLVLNVSYTDMVEQFMASLDSQRSGLLYRPAKQTVRHCLIVMSGVLSLLSFTNLYAEDTPGIHPAIHGISPLHPAIHLAIQTHGIFTLGAGVGSAPKYPGSDTIRTRVVPLFDVNYGRFFLAQVD